MLIVGRQGIEECGPVDKAQQENKYEAFDYDSRAYPPSATTGVVQATKSERTSCKGKREDADEANNRNEAYCHRNEKECEDAPPIFRAAYAAVEFNQFLEKVLGGFYEL